jgi:quercetin dioxygenase-like cupin family protein
MTAADTVSERVAFDQDSGSEALEQRLLRFGPGLSQPRGPGAKEEALFVLSGSGTLIVDGERHELEPEAAALVPPGSQYSVDAGEEIEMVSVRTPPAGDSGAPRVVRLAEQDAAAATSEREFRILLDPDTGLSGGTLFVGYIPEKKAPEHYHTYDEVIYVLEGEGTVHIGEQHTPIAPGSCIHLTPELRHIVENTGTGEMRVVALFRPAGSPAEAYLPDGSPAYVPKEDS